MSIVTVTSQPAVGPIDDLSKDLISVIIGEFPPLERSALGCVSRIWNDAVRERLLWPASLDELNCRVIDEPVWRQHEALFIEKGAFSFEDARPIARNGFIGFVKDVALRLFGKRTLSFEGTRPIAKNDIVAIMKVTKFYARLQAAGLQIEGHKGVTILTIPKEMSIHLVHIVFKDRIRSIWDTILEKIGQIPVERAYQVIITNHVLESIGNDEKKNTRGKSKEIQMEIVGRAGCGLPPVLVAMLLPLMTEKVDSTIRFFGDNTGTYMRCDDVVYMWPLNVGDFSPAGLSVSGNCDFGRDSFGAAGLRKF